MLLLRRADAEADTEANTELNGQSLTKARENYSENLHTRHFASFVYGRIHGSTPEVDSAPNKTNGQTIELITRQYRLPCLNIDCSPVI